jgi:hypothetical protein
MKQTLTERWIREGDFYFTLDGEEDLLGLGEHLKKGRVVYDMGDGTYKLNRGLYERIMLQDFYKLLRRNNFNI